MGHIFAWMICINLDEDGFSLHESEPKSYFLKFDHFFFTIFLEKKQNKIKDFLIY